MARIKRFAKTLEAGKECVTKISEETEEHSKIAKDFLTKKRYNIIDDRKNVAHLIKRFYTIGFPDPFPDDDKHIIGSVDDVPDDLANPECIDDRVYPDSRYKRENSPYCIYIPCREVMLKLMRACIKVKEPEDLWLMQNKEELRGLWRAAPADGEEHDDEDGHECIYLNRDI